MKRLIFAVLVLASYGSAQMTHVTATYDPFKQGTDLSIDQTQTESAFFSNGKDATPLISKIAVGAGFSCPGEFIVSVDHCTPRVVELDFFVDTGEWVFGNTNRQAEFLVDNNPLSGGKYEWDGRVRSSGDDLKESLVLNITPEVLYKLATAMDVKVQLGGLVHFSLNLNNLFALRELSSHTTIYAEEEAKKASGIGELGKLVAEEPEVKEMRPSSGPLDMKKRDKECNAYAGKPSYSKPYYCTSTGIQANVLSGAADEQVADTRPIAQPPKQIVTKRVVSVGSTPAASNSVTAAAGTTPSSAPPNEQSETLGSVKQKYLTRKVVLIGDVSDNLGPQPAFVQWLPATEAAGRYSTNMASAIAAGEYSADTEFYLPATFKGKTAIVIAIQLNDLQKQRTVNAPGESISPDNIVDPYLDLVVRLSNGEIAMTTGYPNTIPMNVRLASQQNATAHEMAAKLPGVVGRSFFASGFSRLYYPDATLEEILGTSRLLKQISNVPFLEPLKITAVKYDETADAVILKVKLPDGREALSVAIGDETADKYESFMTRISGLLLSEIPKTLTPQEIVAIKKQSVFRGMSEDALYNSLGFPQSENDWGRDGKQFVYTNSLMVYLNDQHQVVDWQSLDNK